MERNNLMSSIPQNDEQLREAVRTNYAKTAMQVLGTSPADKATCCGTDCCSPGANQGDPIYAGTAMQVLGTSPADKVACCGTDCCSPSANQGDSISSDLYTSTELSELPV